MRRIQVNLLNKDELEMCGKMKHNKYFEALVDESRAKKMNAKAKEDVYYASNRTVGVTLISGKRFELIIKDDITESSFLSRLAGEIGNGVLASQLRVYRNSDIAAGVYFPVFMLQSLAKIRPYMPKDNELLCFIAPLYTALDWSILCNTQVPSCYLSPADCCTQMTYKRALRLAEIDEEKKALKKTQLAG